MALQQHLTAPEIAKQNYNTNHTELQKHFSCTGTYITRKSVTVDLHQLLPIFYKHLHKPQFIKDTALESQRLILLLFTVDARCSKTPLCAHLFTFERNKTYAVTTAFTVCH